MHKNAINKTSTDTKCHTKMCILKAPPISSGNSIFVISGLDGNIDSEGATIKRIRVKDPKYPRSPSAAFIKFDDRESGNVYLVKVRIIIFTM